MEGDEGREMLGLDRCTFRHRPGAGGLKGITMILSSSD